MAARRSSFRLLLMISLIALPYPSFAHASLWDGVCNFFLGQEYTDRKMIVDTEVLHQKVGKILSGPSIELVLLELEALKVHKSLPLSNTYVAKTRIPALLQDANSAKDRLEALALQVDSVWSKLSHRIPKIPTRSSSYPQVLRLSEERLAGSRFVLKTVTEAFTDISNLKKSEIYPNSSVSNPVIEKLYFTLSVFKLSLSHPHFNHPDFGLFLADELKREVLLNPQVAIQQWRPDPAPVVLRRKQRPSTSNDDTTGPDYYNYDRWRDDTDAETDSGRDSDWGDSDAGDSGGDGGGD